MPDVRSRDRFIDYVTESINVLKEDLQRFLETRPIEIATILTFCSLFYWIQQWISA
ncbi:hypothetical protein WN51_04878 [Melipona quadrifasciata]|uniref:Uncharacterized protein n=1 Tax=Melipona quadrifasciata TaxID=166423 RepID=A0A0N0BDA7_9HYME|nr:hypothetical protein WN51_04878 [Melipona quadrifasciata]